MKITLIASEGGAGHYPENTNYAVRHSLQGAVDGCELDFHLTADKSFVAHHDYQLKPALTRDETGHWLASPGPVIKNTSLGELRRYEIGMLDPASRVRRHYPQRASIPDEKIATLQDIEASFIDSFSEKKSDRAELWFEAKTDPFDPDRTTPAENYVQALKNALPNSPLFPNTVLIAFDWRLLQIAQQLMPGIQTGFLSVDFSWMAKPGTKPDVDKLSGWYGDFDPRNCNGSFPQAVKAAGGTYWSPYFRDIKRGDVDEAHAVGLKVSTWGADSVEDISYALSTGVDSLTTGYVNRAREILKKT